MHAAPDPQADRPLHVALSGVPLSVVFASGEDIELARTAGRGVLPLVPPLHVSDADAYLVLPEDIGIELVDILRDGDVDLVHEAMRDGLLCVGTVARPRKGVVALEVERCTPPALALRAGMPFAAEVALADGDPIETLNDLPHVQCTVASELVDDDGFDAILREDERVGASWRVTAETPPEQRGAEPTWTWSRRLPDGRVGLELVVFQEYDELVALLRPACLDPR